MITGKLLWQTEINRQIEKKTNQIFGKFYIINYFSLFWISSCMTSVLCILLINLWLDGSFIKSFFRDTLFICPAPSLNTHNLEQIHGNVSLSCLGHCAPQPIMSLVCWVVWNWNSGPHWGMPWMLDRMLLLQVQLSAVPETWVETLTSNGLCLAQAIRTILHSEKWQRAAVRWR